MRRRIQPGIALIAVCLSLFGTGLRAEEGVPFSIGGMTVAPGEVKSGKLDVPAGEDPGSFIPITVINGMQRGKVLALVAGVHGYEYPPVLALLRLKNSIDPRTLSGTVVMVHVANLPAFQKRIIYYNPYDWKNLNRVFPGDANGTSTQRIARILTEEIVKKCDFLIDLHCGDGNEALIPYCYWMVGGKADVNDVSREMVLAFGIKYIIIDDTRTQDLAASRYLANTAILLGKPAITTESGYLGGTDEEDVARNVQGSLSVMRHFGMIPGTSKPVAEPVWIDKYEVVYSDVDGLFFPQTEMGYYVSEGEKVGVVTDYFGNPIKEFRAPFTGIMLYIIATPPTAAGEPLFEVGRIKGRSDRPAP